MVRRACTKPLCFFFSLSSNCLVIVAGNAQWNRVTKAKAFGMEHRKGKAKRFGNYQGDCREEGAQESNLIKLFLNSWASPKLHIRESDPKHCYSKDCELKG